MIDPKYAMAYNSSMGPSPAHLARPPMPESRPSSAGMERPAHSPRYANTLPPPSAQRPPHGTSPMQSQMFMKHSAPVKSGPPAPHAISMAHPPTSHGTPMVQSGLPPTPPPAHGGSARHPGVHVPTEPLPNLMNHHPVIANPLRHSPPMAHSGPVDLPLDLGFAAKRRSETQDFPIKRRAEAHEDFPGSEDSASPRKLVRIEPNAQLFKVSEPSVLPQSEPSIITTVINSAVSGVDPSSLSNENTMESQSEVSTAKEDQNEEQPGGQPFGYIHKLKKAWIKSYSTNEPASNSGSGSNPGTPPSQQQSSSVRATPSPAPSNKSTGSATSSNRGRGMIASAAAKITASKPVNGHASAADKKSGRLSSSSESEEDDDDSQTYSSSGVRKKTSGRGRKGIPLRQRGSKTARVPRSASSGDSDKDSDISMANSRNSKANSAASRKRGRKPGRGGLTGRNTSVANSPSRGLSKKVKEDVASMSSSSTTSGVSKSKTSKKKKKPTLAQLKKTGQSFLQNASCFEVAPKLAKCRECRWTQSQRNKKMPNIFCRFYAFRRVKYAKNGQLCVAGFCDPKKDVNKEDIALWLSSADSAPNNLDEDQASFLLENLKDEFDIMLKQERQATNDQQGDDQAVAWKRVVQGVREMCDVCDANLFNFHWACGICGFVVCLDCYQDRKNEVVRLWGGQDRDKYSWLLCANRNQHELSKLMLTQIIADDALEKVALRLREETKKSPITTNGVVSKKESDTTHLRDLIGTEQKIKIPELTEQTAENVSDDKKGIIVRPLKHFVRCVNKGDEASDVDKNYVWRHGLAPVVRSYSLAETKQVYPGVSHNWLCDGKVLRIELPETDDKKSVELFQELWKRGQPVVIGKATKKMNLSLWDPAKLNSDFGGVSVELINIQTGELLPGDHTLKKFWEGFSNVSKRLRDEDGEPALVKLKDWPTSGKSGEEFLETLPNQCADIISGLPLPAYTNRGKAGKFNLAANLPDLFIRPDLGPRSYISYGDSQSPECGTFNLHLDLADTMWVMVRAETPSDLDKPEYKNQVMRTLETVGCNEEATQGRASNGTDSLPGCLWHVFHPADADSIRDLLNRESAEKRAKAKRMITKKSRSTGAANSAEESEDGDSVDGDKTDSNFDPIYEETCYLTGDLLKKLKEDYGISPFVFTLFEGEALVIPAGAPRQVKYLQSCISVCVDFVSPESLSHSCQMVRQYRFLPENQHPAPEDRFQVKNLVYHSVKRALSVKEKKRHDLTKKNRAKNEPTK